MNMTKEEMAAKLHGREMGSEFTREDRVAAKAAGLIAVYGYSDDCVEVDGVSCDERGIAPLVFIRKGLIEQHEDECECKFCCYAQVVTDGKKVKPEYKDGVWRFWADIPHATFDIMDDGALYCRGIVFSLSDCPEVKL